MAVRNSKAIPVPQDAEEKQVYETYVLKGMNLTWPDQRTPDGEAALAQDCRMLDDNNEESRVAISTRKGPGFYTVPVGETLNVQQTSTTGASTGTMSATTWYADKFVPNTNGRLTKLDFRVRKNTGAGTILVKIFSDDGGEPGTLLATSSYDTAALTDSMTYLSAYFIEAPDLTSGSTYWAVFYQQDNAIGNFVLSTTTNTTTGLTSIVSGNSWTALNASLNIKTYLSTSGRVKGAFRRYSQTVDNVTIFAHGTSMYQVNDGTGAVTAIKTGMNADATVYRFAHSENKTYWVNGQDNKVYVWDGTTVTDFSSPVSQPHLIAIHENRMFLVGKDDETKVVWSELGNFESYLSTGFFYAPSPKSGDPVTALVEFQDYMVVFTLETKHMLHGKNPAQFTRRQTMATKGTWSQESVAVDRNYMYFVSDDGAYRSNGVVDEILSDKIKRELDTQLLPGSNTSVCLYKNQFRIYYAHSPSAINNRCLIYDFVYKQWFLDVDAYIAGALVKKQEDGALLEFSCLVGAGYYGEVLGSNLGKPLFFRYWTNYRRYNSGAQLHRIKKVKPIIRATGLPYNLLVSRDKDFNNSPSIKAFRIAGTGASWGDGSEWGDGTTWGSARLSDKSKSFSGRSKYTQLRFEREGVENDVNIYGYIVIYKSGRIRG